MLETRTDIYGQFRGGLSYGDHKHPSTITVISCSWAVPFKVSCFSALVTGWAYSKARDLVDGSCWCLTEMDNVPLSVAIFAMHLPASPSVMEVTLVAFRKGSIVLFYGSWRGEDCGRLNSNNLLLLSEVLGWLFLLVVLKLSFVVPSSCLVKGGCRSVMAGMMVDELLCQLLGAVEGSWC